MSSLPFPSAVWLRKNWVLAQEHRDHISSLNVRLTLCSQFFPGAKIGLLIISSIPTHLAFTLQTFTDELLGMPSHLKWQIKVEEPQISQAAKKS